MEKKTEEKEQSERARNMDWAFFPITTQDFGLLQLYVYRKKIQITGPEQSMKIDDRKFNRSINDNQLITVDWHRLASTNR